MVIPNPKYLSRYRDLALLLIKYKQRDLVHKLGLDKLFESHETLHQTPEEVDARHLVADLEKLGPTFVKLGQLLSTRPDMLPSEYLEALTRLQDNVTPMPFSCVRDILHQELGVDMSAVFRIVDEKPLASASIGQVHWARLHSGEEVVVKVQRPGIREEIFTDLEVLGQLAQWLDSYTDIGHRYRFALMLTSLRRSLLKEVDYRIEAENALRFASNLQEFRRIRIPRPYLQYTTDRVLTLQYIDGAKITALTPSELAVIDREELARELFCSFLHQALIDGFFHADPHPGNVLLTPGGYIAFIDFGMVVSIPASVQEYLLKMVLALNEANGDEVAGVATSMGTAEEGFNKGRFREMIRELVAEHSDAPLERLQTGRIILEMQSIAGVNNLRLPTELIMLGKTLMNLDRLLQTFAPSFVPSAEMRRYTGTVIRRRSQSMLTLDGIFRAALEAGELARALPYRLNKITQMLADNELHFQVTGFNEKRLLASIEKVANRVTTGLILAALIVGASLIVRLDSPYYRSIAFLFYILASVGGAYLVILSFFRDER